jgi:hypothetical protein
MHTQLTINKSAMNNESLALLIDELRFTMSLEVLLNALNRCSRKHLLKVLTGRSRHKARDN